MQNHEIVTNTYLLIKKTRKMKIKYFLPVMALPLMVACSQDELVEQVGTEVSKVERPSAGKVTFVNGTPESRFNFYKNNWEKGEKLHLFQMDRDTEMYETANETVEKWILEEDNANETWYMDQVVWNDMYEIRNYYNTNFPFEFDGSKWTNDDETAEGNYFAVVPSKARPDHLTKLTNRRDVWLYINPVQELTYDKVNSGSIEGMEENQFFLGYTQIYRNQTVNSETGELQLPINMKPILANIDLSIKNVSEESFRVEKMVISRKDGGKMNTLAYIRPADNTPANFGFRQDDQTGLWNSHVNTVKAAHSLTSAQKWADYQEFGPAFAQPYFTENNVPGDCDKLEKGYYWTNDSWTRTAARSVVEYSYPGENDLIPYACKGEMAGVAYEYVIKFNNASNKGYVELAKGEYIRAMITLPHDMDLHDYVVTIYGQQEQSDRSRWNEGIIIPDLKGYYTVPVEGTSQTENDGRFKFQNIALNSEKDYLEADVHFSDFKVGRSRIVQTTNSEDLLKHLKSYYGENAEPDQNKNTLFYVEAINDFVVTNELVAYVQKLTDNYNVNQGSKAGVFFTNVTDGGEIVFPKELTATNAIDLFFYNNNVGIRNEGTQIINRAITVAKTENGGVENNDELLDWIETTLAKGMNYGISYIENAGTLTINKDVVAANNEYSIWNYEGATLTIDEEAEIYGKSVYSKRVDEDAIVHNHGTLNLNDATIHGLLENHNLTKVNGTADVYTLMNVKESDNCTTCITTPAAIIDIESGSLTVNEEVGSANNGTINNKASFIIKAAYFANNAEINNMGTVTGIVSNNAPKAEFNNGNEDATVAGYVYGTLSNSGVVNAYKGEIKSLKNIGGTLNVWYAEGNSVQTTANSEGEIVFKGVAALHIGLGGKDERVFEVQASQKGITSQEVLDMMKVTLSTTLRTAYDIQLTEPLSQEAFDYSKANVTMIEVMDNRVDLYGANYSNVIEYNNTFKKATVYVIGDKAELHIENAKIVVKDVNEADRPKVHVASGSDLKNEANAVIPGVIYHK